jgi:hypothetical protein
LLLVEVAAQLPQIVVLVVQVVELQVAREIFVQVQLLVVVEHKVEVELPTQTEVQQLEHSGKVEVQLLLMLGVAQVVVVDSTVAVQEVLRLIMVLDIQHQEVVVLHSQMPHMHLQLRILKDINQVMAK